MKLCMLKEVDISCTCKNIKCNDKLKTICNSFSEKNKKIRIGGIYQIIL